MLDVGQGDAILVEGSRGGRLLIDGGPDPDRLLVALDQRIPPWDRRIDVVILSHPHEDHVAGPRPAPGSLPGAAGSSSPACAGRDPATRHGRAARIDRVAGAPGLAAGDRLAVDDIDLRVLWPTRGGVPVEPPDGGTGINNVSIVLLGAVGDRRFLLAGDVEEAIDPSLLAAGLPRVDLLKVAHHGSRTATTQAFVDAVRPRIAIASAGTGQPVRTPHACDARALVRGRRPGLPHGSRRDRRRHVRRRPGPRSTPKAVARSRRARAGRRPQADPRRIDGRSRSCAGSPLTALVPDPRPPKPIAPVAVRPGGTPTVGLPSSR